MKLYLTTLALGFALVFTGPQISEAQDFEKGLAAYERGDFETAVREWRPLADQGHVQATEYLLQMHRNGEGRFEEDAKAVAFFQKAAEQGSGSAQLELATMYHDGMGVDYNAPEAFKWYNKAAQQGVAEAQFQMAMMYSSGEGTLHDYVYAHMWLNLAAAQGHDFAVQQRDSLAKDMTKEDVSKAQDLARECLKKSYKGC